MALGEKPAALTGCKLNPEEAWWRVLVSVTGPPVMVPPVIIPEAFHLEETFHIAEPFHPKVEFHPEETFHPEEPGPEKPALLLAGMKMVLMDVRVR